jgi:hypothetical protein
MGLLSNRKWGTFTARITDTAGGNPGGPIPPGSQLQTGQRRGVSFRGWLPGR